MPLSQSETEQFKQAMAAGGIEAAPRLPGLNVDIGKTYNGPELEAFANPIADQCRQLGAFRETRGNLPEPLWYAGLGVLAFCSDGDGLAQQWSAGHSGYSEFETKRKLEHARRDASGPTLCSRFEALNPSGCDACPYRKAISTPLVLGRANIAPEAGPVVATAAPEAQPVEPGEPRRDVQPAIAIPKPPEPFFYARGLGDFPPLLARVEGDDGQLALKRVYSYPIFVEDVRRETGKDAGDLVILNHWLPKEGWRLTPVPNKDLRGSQFVAALASRSINVEPKVAMLFRDYIVASLLEWHKLNRIRTMYNQFGWRDDGTFLLGNDLYKPDGSRDRVICTPSVQATATLFDCPDNASLDAWRGAVAPVLTPGYEYQAFALACSFAAPLFALIDDASVKGAVVAIVGPGGDGKTVGCYTPGWSVWGQERAVAIGTGDSVFGKLRFAGMMHSLPMLADDWATTGGDPKFLASFIEQFIQGAEARKGTKEGDLREGGLGWKTIIIANSNSSIASIMHVVGRSPLASRILEVRSNRLAGSRLSQAEKNAMQNTLERNRGVAGRRFLNLIVPQQAKIKALLDARVKYYSTMVPKTEASEWRSYVPLLAAVDVAISLLALGDDPIIEMDRNRIMKWALDVTALSAHSQVESTATPMQYLALFLNEHTRSTLRVPGAWKQGAAKLIPDNFPDKVIVRYEKEGQQIYIDQSTFHKWLVERNALPNYVYEELSAAGIVKERGKFATLTAGTMMPGGQTRVWHIDGAHPQMTQALTEVVETGEKIKMTDVTQRPFKPTQHQ